jgi:hypothetical protein
MTTAWTKIKGNGKKRLKLKEIFHTVISALRSSGVMGTANEEGQLTFCALGNSVDTIEGLLEVLRYQDVGGSPMTDSLPRVTQLMRDNPDLNFKNLQKGFTDIGRSQNVAGGTPKRHERNQGLYPILFFDIRNPLRTADGVQFGKDRARSVVDHAVDAAGGAVRMRSGRGKEPPRPTGPLPAFLQDQIGPYHAILRCLGKHTGQAAAKAKGGDLLKGVGSTQDHEALIGNVDALLTFTAMRLTPSRTGEISADSTGVMYFVNVYEPRAESNAESQDGEPYAVPHLARAIDLLLKTPIALDDSRALVIGSASVKCKPRGKKCVHHVREWRLELPNGLRGITMGMVDLCMALKFSAASPFLPYVGRTDVAVRARLGGGCKLQPYAIRNRHAIEAKAHVEAGLQTELDATRLFGHVKGSSMIADVYAEADKTAPIPPFPDQMEVPSDLAEKRKWDKEMDEERCKAYPRPAFASKRAVELSLFLVDRMIAALKGLGMTAESLADAGAPSRERVHAEAASDAARVYSDIYRYGSRTYSTAQSNELLAACMALEPTRWSDLRALVETAPPRIDVEMGDWGTTPASVIDAISAAFSGPPSFD